MGLTPIGVRADTGPIGGNLSHEFHILANTGESTLYYDNKLFELLESEDIESPEEHYMQLQTICMILKVVLYRKNS